MPSLYLAARFTRQAELRGYRKTLAENGVRVTSRWLDEPAEGDFANISDAYRMNCAKVDVEDVKDADMLVSFSGGPPGGGGRHAEFGMGVAFNKILVVIGPKEQIFHYLPEVLHFNTFEEFVEWVK